MLRSRLSRLLAEDIAIVVWCVGEEAPAVWVAGWTCVWRGEAGPRRGV